MPRKGTAPKTDVRRRRLTSDERRTEFIQKSIKLFAQEGFESSTRELARRLEVTQPLLYRYFPSKRDLIEAVHEEVYIGMWQPEWEALIADRNRPLRDRLIEFYRRYTEAIFHPDWIRIFLHSGLKGEEINRHYVGLAVDRILRPIIAEIRAEAKLPPKPPSEAEIDAVLALHGGIFYYGVIKLVYEQVSPDRKDRVIAFSVEAMISTLTREMRESQRVPRAG